MPELVEQRILEVAGMISDPALERLPEVDRMWLVAALRQLDKALARCWKT